MTLRDIFGFRRGAVETFALLGCYAATGSLLPTNKVQTKATQHPKGAKILSRYYSDILDLHNNKNLYSLDQWNQKNPYTGVKVG
jgi:hypothetical protein